MLVFTFYQNILTCIAEASYLLCIYLYLVILYFKPQIPYGDKFRCKVGFKVGE